MVTDVVKSKVKPNLVIMGLLAAAVVMAVLVITALGKPISGEVLVIAVGFVSGCIGLGAKCFDKDEPPVVPAVTVDRILETKNSGGCNCK